jgi:hypothetical protein
MDITHQTLLKSKTIYGPTTITSDIVDSIRTGGTSGGRSGGRLVR